MTKLKYRLQEGEEIMDYNNPKDLKDYEIIVAVVKKKPITEKELVKKVKTTVKRENDVVTKLVKKLNKKNK